MILNGEIASPAQEICDFLSVKFASVFTDEILSDDHISRAARNVADLGQSLGAINVNLTMIIRAASELKSSFMPGFDEVPSDILKQHIDSLFSDPSLSPVSNVPRKWGWLNCSNSNQ